MDLTCAPTPIIPALKDIWYVWVDALRAPLASVCRRWGFAHAEVAIDRFAAHADLPSNICDIDVLRAERVDAMKYLDCSRVVVHTSGFVRVGSGVAPPPPTARPLASGTVSSPIGKPMCMMLFSPALGSETPAIGTILSRTTAIIAPPHTALYTLNASSVVRRRSYGLRLVIAVHLLGDRDQLRPYQDRWPSEVGSVHRP